MTGLGDHLDFQKTKNQKKTSIVSPVLFQPVDSICGREQPVCVAGVHVRGRYVRGVCSRLSVHASLLQHLL